MAIPQADGSHRLHGFKWFTSATDADVTLTLARVQGRGGATAPVQRSSFSFHPNIGRSDLISELLCVPQGSRGLSLFYAEVRRDEGGRLEGIEVQRLKDKLGTRQMPTAELLLDGLRAHRVRFRVFAADRPHS